MMTAGPSMPSRRRFVQQASVVFAAAQLCPWIDLAEAADSDAAAAVAETAYGNVRGRVVRGVNVFPSQIEEIILKDQRLAPHFVIELRRTERLDEITVVVESRLDAEGVYAACDRDLAHHIKATVGVTAAVRTVKPGTVESRLW